MSAEEHSGRPPTSIQRRVAEHLNNPFLTTPEQAAAATHNGDAFVAACPGAGKTHTVGLRLAYHAAYHSGASIAALSHTNTAIEAIRASARKLVLLPDDYFLDTLHAFLLRYVVYPFGHLYMKCGVTPQVVGDDREWPNDIPTIGVPDHLSLRVNPWRMSVDVGGELSYQRPSNWPPVVTEEMILDSCAKWCAAEKRAYWGRGLLSYSDVLWVAYNVLQEHPPLAKAVAARFDELIVDEVQDTGGLQLACLALLREHDQRPNLVVVGDICQAVFEWSGATPNGLRTFAEEQQLAELPLTSNFRSSQNICDVTYRFSTREQADRARGSNANSPDRPELWRYARGAEVDLVDRFRARLGELDIEEHDAAVLAWRHRLVRRLSGEAGEGGPNMHWLLRVLGEAAVERDNRTGPGRETFASLDRAVNFIAFGSPQPTGLTPGQRESVRAAAAMLLAALPKVEGGLRDWNLAARQLLGSTASTVEGAEPTNVNRFMKDAAALRNIDAHEALTPAPVTLARTIHDAKGESIHAVIVVASEEDATQWASEAWTDEPPEETTEVLRVAYVALTRAERFLVLALPEGVTDDVASTYVSLGFTEP